MASSSSSSVNNNNRAIQPGTQTDQAEHELAVRDKWLSLPSDITRIILHYLPMPSAIQVVGRFEWNNLTYLDARGQLWENYTTQKAQAEFPKLQIIDRAVWEMVFGKERLAAYNLTFDDVKLRGEALVLQNQQLRAAIKALHNLDLVKNEDGIDQGITLLTLPKGLNIEILVKLVNNVAIDTPKIITSNISEETMAVTVMNTEKVVITNSVLLASSDIGDKVALAEQNGGEMPTLLATAALATITYMNSPRESRINLFVGNGVYATCAGSKAFSGFDNRSLIKGFIASPLYNNLGGVGVMKKISPAQLMLEDNQALDENFG